MNTAQDLIGHTLHGKFVITDVLGEGAMGIVYRGFDDATLDEVAIKVLQPSLSGNDEVVRRFQGEAAATRRVDHESTVRVLGRGCEAGLYYLVMELLHGKSLASVLTESRQIPEGRAARLVIQLCGALDVAHGRGVVHRDIKPDNIMLIDGGSQVGERVKLLDFGIAKRIAQADQRVEDSFSAGAETRYGALLGTPEYMAPEQCMGRDVDQRTDVYACGVLLYRMVTGQVPFDGTNAHPFELCQRHIGEDPAPPHTLAPWIRPDMEAIILKALCKAPDARQQSAAELRDELVRLVAAVEAIEVERTERFIVEDLVHADDAARVEAELAAPVVIAEAPSAGLPTLTLDDDPPSDHDPILVATPVIPAEPLELPAPPVVAVVEDRHTPLPSTRLRRGAVGRLQSYLPTVALAAVVGAGLGSLLVALAPFVQR